MNKLELIKQVREITQAGMNDVKKALEESNYDVEAAVDLIKVKGLNVVASRSSAVAAEGLVKFCNVNDQFYLLAEVNSQTDFFAKSPQFDAFTNNVLAGFASHIVKHGKLEEVNLNEVIVGNASLESMRQELVATNKENVVVRRVDFMEVEDDKQFIVPYVHTNNKLGVLVRFSTEHAATDETIALVQNIAMQIAAMAPLGVSKDNLSEEEVARQRAIFETQLKELNKPDAAWAKIIEGKFKKWHSEVCLLEQDAVWANKKSVKELLPEGLTVLNFIRIQVGEGVEKPTEDYADAVNELIK